MAITVDGRDAVKIENANDAPLQVNLLTIAPPPFAAQQYALSGEVRYENVRGDGYLEMWNYFPPAKPGLPEDKYFSRTLGENGAMGKISGTSGWRDFMLPFDRSGSASGPTKLQVNLILPGRGTVYLGPMKLTTMAKTKSPGAASHSDSWWSDRSAAMFGACGGVIIGGLGGMIGLLGALGKGRRFAMVTLALMTVAGFALLTAGIIAVALQQPYAVWYPLILGGIILTAISPGLLWLFFQKKKPGSGIAAHAGA